MLYLITPCVNLPLSLLISVSKAIFSSLPHGSHNNANYCIIFSLHLLPACWVDAGHLFSFCILQLSERHSTFNGSPKILIACLISLCHMMDGCHIFIYKLVLYIIYIYNNKLVYREICSVFVVVNMHRNVCDRNELACLQCLVFHSCSQMCN